MNYFQTVVQILLPQIRKLIEWLNLLQYFADEQIKWHFNPPSAPHFGGIWETAVKSSKSHLKRTIGDHKLTLEEFLTLIAQIESCLNSRPLCPVSDNPAELSALPGHFLVGTTLSSIPEENLLNENIPPLKCWQLTQKLFQNFWKRWVN
nr:uncharacterized protein LOC122270943 [Parasteatoda tepidariorum]